MYIHVTLVPSLSVCEALTHGGLANGTHIDLKWINSEDLSEENAEELLGDAQGILVPGGSSILCGRPVSSGVLIKTYETTSAFQSLCRSIFEIE